MVTGTQLSQVSDVTPSNASWLSQDVPVQHAYRNMNITNWVKEHSNKMLNHLCLPGLLWRLPLAVVYNMHLSHIRSIHLDLSSTATQMHQDSVHIYFWVNTVPSKTIERKRPIHLFMLYTNDIWSEIKKKWTWGKTIEFYFVVVFLFPGIYFYM